VSWFLVHQVRLLQKLLGLAARFTDSHAVLIHGHGKLIAKIALGLVGFEFTGLDHVFNSRKADV
jgi:hypothetical protein